MEISYPTFITGNLRRPDASIIARLIVLKTKQKKKNWIISDS